MTLKKNKVVLGLSGGVDSTAAVLILREKGFEVVGFYFDVSGCNVKGAEHAQQVADQLGIKLIIEDVSKDFSEIVINNFCNEFNMGRTPNPCIMCNPNIKFRKLREVADAEEAYYMATGHYASIVEDNGKYYIAQGKNIRKDQSYMLYRLGQDITSRLIFPLGEIDDKKQVREMAKKKGMINADDKDSQEICFIDSNMNHKEYLRERGFVSRPGNFIDKDGNILGRHEGISSYTIGQRKGLGLALGKPAFVVDIDYKNNLVVIGDNEDLFKREIISCDNVFADENIDLSSPIDVKAKIRYGAEPAKASIMRLGNEIKTVFDTPQRAATPGQSIVFYENGKVIGGGFIK